MLTNLLKKPPHPPALRREPSPARGEGDVVPAANSRLTSAERSPLPARERAGAEGDRVRGLLPAWE
jgi:hypothetical protein